MIQTLRRTGGSLIMTVPKVFVDQNQLYSGAQVQVHVDGDQLVVKAMQRPSYKLEDLLAQMPNGLPRVKGWDRETETQAPVRQVEQD